jgi:HD-GYP domain-containing protein (c-di-GMP phosphodiesterase class II)
MADALAVSADRSSEQPTVRLAELVAALSLGVDLGLGLDEQTRSAVYYTALLINVGCHSDAHEQAKWFGDDIELKSHKYDHGPRSILGAAASMRLLGRGNPALHRFRVGLNFVLSGHRDLNGMITRHAELAHELARELGLPAGVQEAVGTSYEQWDGKGWPGNVRGDDVPIASRLAQLAEYVEVAHRIGGPNAAILVARKRGGSQFDPALTRLLIRDADEILDGLDSAQTWEAVIAAEPSLRVTLSAKRLDAALLGVANFVDLKSPYTLGHAQGVCELVAAAGVQFGLGADDVLTLRRAGLVSGLGRLGISNAIWDKRGPLGSGEWERVRMHPYLTERMLHQSSSLAPLGSIAVQQRERLDGSGYPRGLSGGALTLFGRILGAADAYQSMSEPRPHRGALSAEAAAAELRAESKAGRLDTDAVAAVLAAAGHGTTRRKERHAGLTAREVDVLRLLAQGLSSKKIADALVISPKTARNHIEHIYAKIGTSSRVTASLYAMQSGLLPRQEYRSER